MPRITAASIAEHVAAQEAAVLGAAVRLFSEHGYENVTIADIASEVGLARSSLYRYFPSKAHILLAWTDRELPRHVAESRALLQGPGPPEQRIVAWVHHELDAAADPTHALLREATERADDLDEETRSSIAASHRSLVEPLAATLREAGLPRAEVDVTSELIGSLVAAAARLEARSPRAPRRVVRARVERAVAALLGARRPISPAAPGTGDDPGGRSGPPAPGRRP